MDPQCGRLGVVLDGYERSVLEVSEGLPELYGILNKGEKRCGCWRHDGRCVHSVALGGCGGGSTSAR